MAHVVLIFTKEKAVLRMFFIHLGRFMRAYLISAFATVLVIPLSFFLFEIITRKNISENIIFFSCAAVSFVISTIYTLFQRKRINSDDLPFYVRSRLKKDRAYIKAYFELSALMVRHLVKFSIPLYITKEQVSLFLKWLQWYEDGLTYEHLKKEHEESGITTKFRYKRQTKFKEQDFAELKEETKVFLMAFTWYINPTIIELNLSYKERFRARQAFFTTLFKKEESSPHEDAAAPAATESGAEKTSGAEKGGAAGTAADANADGKQDLADEPQAYEIRLLTQNLYRTDVIPKGVDALFNKKEYRDLLCKFNQMAQARGKYWAEYALVAMARPILSTLPDSVIMQEVNADPYVELFKLRTLKELGDAVVYPKETGTKDFLSKIKGVFAKDFGESVTHKFNEHYQNRYFFLLDNELNRLREHILQSRKARAEAEEEQRRAQEAQSSQQDQGAHNTYQNNASYEDAADQSFGHNYGYGDGGSGTRFSYGSHGAYGSTNAEYSYSYDDAYGSSYTNQGASSSAHNAGATSGSASGQTTGSANSEGNANNAGYAGNAGEAGQNFGQTGNSEKAHDEVVKDKAYYRKASQDQSLSRLQRAYRTLELEDDASLVEVKRQYRRLTFKVHPDHFKNKDISDVQKARMEEEFYRLREAYDFILFVLDEK